LTWAQTAAEGASNGEEQTTTLRSRDLAPPPDAGGGGTVELEAADPDLGRAAGAAGPKNAGVKNLGRVEGGGGRWEGLG
jgi:hypothetical protein